MRSVFPRPVAFYSAVRVCSSWSTMKSASSHKAMHASHNKDCVASRFVELSYSKNETCLALSTNTRGDCIICTSRELPKTADRADSHSRSRHTTVARTWRNMCEASLLCFGRITSHLEVLGPVTTIVAKRTCLQTRRTLYTALVGLRTFWFSFFIRLFTQLCEKNLMYCKYRCVRTQPCGRLSSNATWRLTPIIRGH